MGVMVFNATFNNISVIPWWSILLVEETGVTGENQTCRKSLIDIEKSSVTFIPMLNIQTIIILWFFLILFSKKISNLFLLK
jgi:hypothetical protein